MTSLVIDASVALKWHVTQPDSNLAEAILRSRCVLCAPKFKMNEMAAVPEQSSLSIDVRLLPDAVEALPG